jgi:hypothetical protein
MGLYRVLRFGIHLSPVPIYQVGSAMHASHHRLLIRICLSCYRFTTVTDWTGWCLVGINLVFQDFSLEDCILNKKGDNRMFQDT